MIKLVVSDLDGTLLPHDKQNIDEETIDIISKVLEKNIYFAIASGRSYRELSNFIKRMRYSIFIISENGALIIYHGKILNKKCIEKNKAINLVNEIERHGYDCLIFGIHTIHTTSKKQTYIDYLNKVKGNVMKIKRIEDLPEDPLRISVYIRNEEFVDKEFIIRAMKSLSISYYGEEWIDFVEIGVNKGMAIQKIKNSFLNKDDKIIAFGDESNDKEMLTMADYSYAMISGNKEIIRICHETTNKPTKTMEKHIKLG